MLMRVMSNRSRPSRSAVQRWVSVPIFLLIALLAVLEGRGEAAPESDGTPPSTPGSLSAVVASPYSVALSWSPSTDASPFSYRVRHSWGYEVSVPIGQTHLVWESNLEAGARYSFSVYAVDAFGNRSRSSNSVSVTLPRDRTPPSAPEVAVTGVGPTHVSLAWSSIDDSPYLWYTVYQNGVPIYPLIGAESATAYLLLPGATYTFTVRARDFGGNFSALSAPVSVTTPPLGPGDGVPPTAPSQLVSDVFDNEISLRWAASSDNRDPQNLISYEISLNGELVDVAVGGRVTSIVYGENGLNLVSIVAVDSSGNASVATSALIAVEF